MRNKAKEYINSYIKSLKEQSKSYMFNIYESQPITTVYKGIKHTIPNSLNYDYFINNVVICEQNDDLLIEQSGKKVVEDFPESFYDYIIKSNFFSIDLTLTEMYNSFLKSFDWQFNNEIKKRLDKKCECYITFCKFDFSDHKDVEKYLIEIMGIEQCSSKQISDFILKLGNCVGFYFYYGEDIHFVVLNTKTLSKRNVLHEFTHLIQHVFDKPRFHEIDNDKLKIYYDQNICDILQIDYDHFLDMFNKNDIVTWTNDFCDSLDILFNKRNDKSLTRSQWIKQTLFSLDLNDKNILNDKFSQTYVREINDGGLQFYIGAYLLNLSFNKIRNVIEKYFED